MTFFSRTNNVEDVILYKSTIIFIICFRFQLLSRIVFDNRTKRKMCYLLFYELCARFVTSKFVTDSFRILYNLKHCCRMRIFFVSKIFVLIFFPIVNVIMNYSRQ